jgi:hypothetical protein
LPVAVLIRVAVDRFSARYFNRFEFCRVVFSPKHQGAKTTTQPMYKPILFFFLLLLFHCGDGCFLG